MPPFKPFKLSPLFTRASSSTAWVRLALGLCALPLAACTAVGEVAYDLRLEHERDRCQALLANSERNSCLERVRDSARQAEQVRKQHEDGKDKRPADRGDLCFTRSTGERVCPN
ncbi:hypothetical protein [Roseateles sp.]|uniref:hypothetical protein n=1 Tax=Roseateles sp. TaxID=1971397 RepID=UPI003D0D9531